MLAECSLVHITNMHCTLLCSQLKFKVLMMNQIAIVPFFPGACKELRVRTNEIKTQGKVFQVGVMAREEAWRWECKWHV